MSLLPIKILSWSLLYGQEPPRGYLLSLSVGSTINYFSNATETAQFAVVQIQLRKMASDTVDPIDWPLPPPLTGQYPWAPLAKCKCAPQYCVRSAGNRTRYLQHTRQPHSPCCRSEYSLEPLTIYFVRLCSDDITVCLALQTNDYII